MKKGVIIGLFVALIFEFFFEIRAKNGLNVLTFQKSRAIIIVCYFSWCNITQIMLLSVADIALASAFYMIKRIFSILRRCSAPVEMI